MTAAIIITSKYAKAHCSHYWGNTIDADNIRRTYEILYGVFNILIVTGTNSIKFHARASAALGPLFAGIKRCATDRHVHRIITCKECISVKVRLRRQVPVGVITEKCSIAVAVRTACHPPQCVIYVKDLMPVRICLRGMVSLSVVGSVSSPRLLSSSSVSL